MKDSGENQKINTEINFEMISGFFRSFEEKEKDSLYEFEVYELLKYAGFDFIPSSMFLEKDTEYSDEELESIPGDRVVLKVVSPNITHKTDAGGVRIVKKTTQDIRKAYRQMIEDVSKNCALMIEKKVIEDEEVKGVLLVQYMVPELNGAGSELLVGIRNSREFGPVISAGVGGTDTELLGGSFRKGQAFVTASTVMTTAEEFLEIFKQTVSYKKLAGLTRGQKPFAIDDQLLTCFSSFILLANYYSSSNPDAPFVIEELEVNPFILQESHLVPLDGLCKFSRHQPDKVKRPWHKIDNLLNPESIGIIGVSTTRINFGRIILNNILAEGYEKRNVRIIRPGMDSFEGITCIPDLESLDIRLDLLVVAVGADQVLPIVELVTEKPVCESVMLIPGGIGETNESKEIAELISRKINNAHSRENGGPVFLGANCLGVISHPGKYDTLFIPEEKLPKQRGVHNRNIAFISQSGAFMITRASKMPDLDPAYMISMGNQNDLTLGDMMSYFKDRDGIDVVAVYAEGFKDLDGLDFIMALKQAVNNGKDVIVYKAGRTTEGKNAAGSHTASIAGDYDVFESCVQQAGGIASSDFTRFSDLLMIAKQLSKKSIKGDRIGILSGAGFEAVGMADSVDENGCRLKIAELSNATLKNLETLLKEKGLMHITEAKNPMDLNPGADDEAHMLAVKYLAEDENVDAVVVGLDPLSPATRTLLRPEDSQYDYNIQGSMVWELPKLSDKLVKPIIGVIDAGKLFDPMVDELRSKGLIVFRSADRAIKALAVYINAQLRKK